MTRFKPGDKVKRIKNKHEGMQVGDYGTVVTASPDDTSIKLAEYNGTHAGYNLMNQSEINEEKMKKLLGVEE